MGKKGGTSWLTAVKRAFRSPTKESHDNRSNKRREEPDQQEEDEEKVICNCINSSLISIARKQNKQKSKCS